MIARTEGKASTHPMTTGTDCGTEFPRRRPYHRYRQALQPFAEPSDWAERQGWDRRPRQSPHPLHWLEPERVLPLPADTADGSSWWSTMAKQVRKRGLMMK